MNKKNLTKNVCYGIILGLVIEILVITILVGVFGSIKVAEPNIYIIYSEIIVISIGLGFVVYKIYEDNYI